MLSKVIPLEPETLFPLVVRVFWKAPGTLPRDHNFENIQDAYACAERYAAMGLDKVAKVELMTRLTTWRRR